jgi:NADH-dependent peroxiredoxin subunit F
MNHEFLIHDSSFMILLYTVPMNDVIIIGGGPAGLAAAIYLARQKVKFLMLTDTVGGQTLMSSDVENYLGFHLIDGPGLVNAFRAHLEDYKGAFELHEGEPVAKVEKMQNGFKVTTGKGVYEAKAVLVATGEKYRELNVPGEKEFYGKGVTYCATCDAPIFAGRDVVVVGGGNSAMDAALFLEKYASHVTIVTINASLQGDAVMKRKCETSKKISILSPVKTTRILGDAFVTGIEVQEVESNTHAAAKAGKMSVIPVQGVFVEIGLVPVSQFIDFVEKDKSGQIIVNTKNETSVPGVWAAGDVTDVTEKQIAVSVGEGSKASLEIIKWLQKR